MIQSVAVGFLRQNVTQVRGTIRLESSSVFGLILLVTLLWPLAAFSDEPVLIRRILDDPERYQLTAVVLSGTVREVNELEPYYISSGNGCYGAYTFTLEDTSGSVSVAVLGFCGIPILRKPAVAEGDEVVVHVHIQSAAGWSTSRYNHTLVPVPEVQQGALSVIATLIQPVSKSEDHADGQPSR